MVSDRTNGTGVADSAGEVRPPVDTAAPANTFDLPETPDSLAIAAITKTMLGETSEEDDQEELEPVDDEDLEPEFEDDEEPEAEPDAPDDQDPADEETPRAKRSVDEWAEVLKRDGLQRVANIPRKELVAALQKFVEREKTQVVTDTATITAAQLETQRQWIKWTMQIDRAAEDDPDGKLAWLESGDANAQQYLQWKSYLDREQAPADQAAMQSSARINQSMQKQVGRLKDNPELVNELEAKHRANPYPADMDGLERLTDDVIELLARDVEARVVKKQEPARKQARERVSAAADRRSAARPDVSPGRGSRPATDADRRIEQSTDPDELFAIGLSRAMNKR